MTSDFRVPSCIQRDTAAFGPLFDSGAAMIAKRARRIADKLRMKAKAKRIYPRDEKARNADHLKCCSCFMCGNPRKWWKQKTISENMADDWQRLQRDWSKVYG